jgi:hypothetical protein
MSPRAMTLSTAAFFAVIILAVLLSGSAALLVPVLILAAILAAGGGVFALLSSRGRRRPGDPAADETDPVPGTAFATDAETPLGDTPEAHDEITPHDLPMGHPGRAAAARLAAASRDGTTRGGARVVAEPPAPRL